MKDKDYLKEIYEKVYDTQIPQKESFIDKYDKLDDRLYEESEENDE